MQLNLLVGACKFSAKTDLCKLKDLLEKTDSKMPRHFLCHVQVKKSNHFLKSSFTKKHSKFFFVTISVLQTLYGSLSILKIWKFSKSFLWKGMGKFCFYRNKEMHSRFSFMIILLHRDKHKGFQITIDSTCQVDLIDGANVKPWFYKWKWA